MMAVDNAIAVDDAKSMSPSVGVGVGWSLVVRGCVVCVCVCCFVALGCIMPKWMVFSTCTPRKEGFGCVERERERWGGAARCVCACVCCQNAAGRLAPHTHPDNCLSTDAGRLLAGRGGSYHDCCLPLACEQNRAAGQRQGRGGAHWGRERVIDEQKRDTVVVLCLTQCGGPQWGKEGGGRNDDVDDCALSVLLLLIGPWEAGRRHLCKHLSTSIFLFLTRQRTQIAAAEAAVAAAADPPPASASGERAWLGVAWPARSRPALPCLRRTTPIRYHTKTIGSASPLETPLSSPTLRCQRLCTMGMTHHQYLAGSRIFGCKACKTHLSSHESLISRVGGRRRRRDGLLCVRAMWLAGPLTRITSLRVPFSMNRTSTVRRGARSSLMLLSTSVWAMQRIDT